MRLRVVNARWCIGFVIFVTINMHFFLWLRKANDKSVNDPSNFNLKYSDLVQKSSTPYDDQVFAGVSHQNGQNDDHGIPRNLLGQKNGSKRMKQQYSEEKVQNHYVTPDDYLIQLSDLPNFSVDGGDFYLSSIIERSLSSSALYLTTLMLCHHALEPPLPQLGNSSKVANVDPGMKVAWRRAYAKFRATKYSPSGARDQTLPQDKYYCEIKHSKESVPYTVPGEFLPNRLTPDKSANRLLDILQCPIQDPENVYRDYARGNGSVSVKIIRGKNLLIRFMIPWESRRIGYLASSSKAASHLDSWKGHQLITEKAQTKAGPSAVDKLHVCIPSVKKDTSTYDLSIALEHVSHHLLIGASHIYLPVPFPWNSPMMNRYTDIFQSYIREGKVSLMSQTGDGVYDVRSVGGLEFSNSAIEVMQINTCLFLSKGIAEYLFVVASHEFFIPQGDNWNFQDVFKSIAAKTDVGQKDEKTLSIWQKSKADDSQARAREHAHPKCYISVASDLVFNPVALDPTDVGDPWIGLRFPHGPRDGSDNSPRAIMPTEKIFQASKNSCGACRLHTSWTTCADRSGNSSSSSSSRNMRRNTHTGQSFCTKSSQQPKRFDDTDVRPTHDFDEIVTEADSYLLNKNSEASVLSFLIREVDISKARSGERNASLYTTRYFQNVLTDLRSRNLELMVRIMMKPIPGGSPAQGSWAPLFDPLDVQEVINPRHLLSGSTTNLRPLPDDFSTRFIQKEVKLPNFAVDYSDYALGAMIERTTGSYDLYATVFFLCHSLLSPKEDSSARSAEKVHPYVVDIWKKVINRFQKTVYADNGVRETPPKFYCKISHTVNGPYYIVEGYFVPNKQTPDSNANKRLDILRCKINDAESAYMNLAGTSHEMLIEILRGDFSLMSFRIPWSIRKVGFMLDEPSDLVVTKYDPWKGFNKSTPGVWSPDRMHMCVGGWEDVPSKTTLPILYEWIQHHILMGVDHVFTAMTFGWKSVSMKRMSKALSCFIDENLLSMTSHSGDELDDVYSSGGLSWGRDNVKNFHVNMCSYYSKGAADYVGVWDADEFFQPRGKYSNILDIIRDMEAPAGPIRNTNLKDADPLTVYKKGYKPQRGMADADGHPFCYLLLNSEVTLVDTVLPDANLYTVYDEPWIGQRFRHGHEPYGHLMGFLKSIRPTRTIFQGGMHMAGACKMPQEWNGCNNNETEFCYSGQGLFSRVKYDEKGKHIDFHLNHHFDEIVMESDARKINRFNEAIINHVQYRRQFKPACAAARAVVGEYASTYFSPVYEALEERGLVMPIELPLEVQNPVTQEDLTADWIDFNKLRTMIYKAREKNSPGDAICLDPPTGSALSGISLRDIMPTAATTPTPINQNNQNAQKMLQVNEDPTTNNNPSEPESASVGVKKKALPSLPAFAMDKSELFLGSMIERESDSWTLHLTTFLLCPSIIHKDTTNTHIKKLRNDRKTLLSWSRAALAFNRTADQTVGRVPHTKYYCKIQASSGSLSYTVPAEFIPNNLSSSASENEKLDVLRCKMEDSQTLYTTLARSDQQVSVEIFRENTSLTRFSVPWKSRVQSRLLALPHDTTVTHSSSNFEFPKNFSSKNPMASAFDPWMGYDENTPGVWKREKLFMCVPGMDSPPSHKTLSVYLEFIQHHLLMGASHIFISAPYAWNGKLMTSLQRVLRSFIADGSLTMHSQADNGEDHLYGILGLSMDKDFMKLLQINLCTYYSKGVADHVAIWGFDDFFIPKGPNKNMLDVINNVYSSPSPVVDRKNGLRAVSRENVKMAGSPGWADKHNHPLCYIEINSELLADKRGMSDEELSDQLWVGKRFTLPTEPAAHSSTHTYLKKSIVPTHNIFQVGLSAHGACRLAYPWHGCALETNGFCNTAEENDLATTTVTHSLYDTVTQSDVKLLHREREAVLYHMPILGPTKITSHTAGSHSGNDYANTHFPKVLEALRIRKLDLLIDIGPYYEKGLDGYGKWIGFDLVYQTRDTMGALVPWFSPDQLHKLAE